MVAPDLSKGQQHLRVLMPSLRFFSVFSFPQGTGLSEAQIKHCDDFVYIPQYGEGTASLNVNVAASIVLHHFAVWAQYPERARHGGKFELGERPKRTAARGMALAYVQIQNTLWLAQSIAPLSLLPLLLPQVQHKSPKVGCSDHPV